MMQWTQSEVKISEIKELLDNNYEVEVTSPDGWVGVNFFIDKGYWQEFILELNDGRMIKCNQDHLFETSFGWLSANQLVDIELVKFLDNSGQYIEGRVKKTDNIIPIVDINVDHENHRYYTDGISSHNTGVGKSLFMCDMASSAFMMGKNVLYITLEMAEERIAERIDSNLLNIPIIEMRKISEENFNKKISAVKSRTNGKLVVKEYPTASANTNHFRSLINELQMKKNFVPDIIFIDYLNICTSARLKVGSNFNSYTFIKAIAEEIRGLAVECSIPIVTATQTTRSGYSNSDIGLEDTSESFGLPATADLMFALISTEELEALNQIMVKQLKNRYNDPTTYRKFVVGIDRSRMKLYDVDQSAQTLVDSGQDEDEDETPLETVNKSPFKFKNKFSDFKF